MSLFTKNSKSKKTDKERYKEFNKEQKQKQKDELSKRRGLLSNVYDSTFGAVGKYFTPREYEKEELIITDNNGSTLFGKIEDISPKILGIKWEIPDNSYGSSNFDAGFLIKCDKATGIHTITFLQTEYYDKQNLDTIKAIEQFKMFEIVQLLSGFNVELPEYCIVYQNMTINKANQFNIDRKGATLPRYHVDGQVTFFLKDDSILRTIISTRPPEHLFLRYIGDSCASTTIKGIYPNEESKQQNDAYRFEVKGNDAIYLQNNGLHHSTPYIQENGSICRDSGNELSRKITKNPRITERTLIQLITPEEYQRLIVKVQISKTYSMSKELFDSYRREAPETRYNVNEYTKNASIRAQLECGGSKSKKRKSKKPASKKLKKRRVFTRKQHSKI